MVLAKKELFEQESQVRANLFKALAHPARLQILKYLAQTRICLSGDLSEMFPLTRTTLNQHMNELKNAGLIEGHEKDGKILYCLVPDKIREMNIILSQFSCDMELPKGFCCEYNSYKISEV
ncbi:MAG: winged helix-turn-helix transcriptional regulator [Bacteroidales bacterium]|nr:winged helix-turn-helix transcriptional regulator [Bacteroidales bacterium]